MNKYKLSLGKIRFNGHRDSFGSQAELAIFLFDE